MENIGDWIRAGKIDAAIQYTEGKLAELAKTDFHQIIGKDLLHLQPILGQFLNNFYKTMTEDEELDIKAIYCEMNAFTVNYDLWCLDLYAYETVEDEDTLNWLATYDGQSEKSLTITGFEDLQLANKEYMKNEGYRDDNQRAACELHEALVILRLHQLFKRTVEQHKNKADWAGIPMFVSAQDYEDMIYVMLN